MRSWQMSDRGKKFISCEIHIKICPEQSYLKEEVYFLIKLTEIFFHILITLQSSQIL